MTPNFSNIKRINVEQAKRILKISLDANLSDKEKTFQVCEIYSGWERRLVDAAGAEWRRIITNNVLRAIYPGKRQSVKHTYIETDTSTYEFDFDPASHIGNEDLLRAINGDPIENIEHVISFFAKRRRRQGYNMPWEKVEPSERILIAHDLKTAKWKQIIEAFQYLAELKLFNIDGGYFSIPGGDPGSN